MDSTIGVSNKVQPLHTQRGAWDQIIQSLIRPPKSTYSKAVLGPQSFKYFGKSYRRLNIEVNHEAETLELSLLEPEFKLKIVVLYLHGNSSSRVEAFSLIEHLPEGYSLACFDFLGCGNSKEQYVSLGVRQSKQIATIVKYLQQKGYQVILWGRSMGAASCLKYGGTKITVVDSSFSSLKGVCRDTAQHNKPRYIPQCVVSCLFPCVYAKLNSDVKEIADFDMNQLDLVKSVENMDENKTIIFLSGLKDSMINHKHSQKLYEAFKGKNKRIFLFEGTHNSKRPREVTNKVFQYIMEQLGGQNNLVTSSMVQPQIELIEMSHQGIRNTLEPAFSL